MDDQTLSNLITITACVAFVTSGWATLLIWRGRRSGWAKLAHAYPAAGKPTGSMPRRWLSITFKPAGTVYPRIITARLTVDGLYLVPSLVCRFGHDAMLIPWDDIEIFAIETYPADRLYDLKFARHPQVRLRVSVAIAQFIRRAADNSHYFNDDEPQSHPIPRAPAPRQAVG